MRKDRVTLTSSLITQTTPMRQRLLKYPKVNCTSSVRELYGVTGNACEFVHMTFGLFQLTAQEFRYNDAMLTIRRSNVEHNFQLVITRVFEEGDQELLEDEDESM